MDILREVSNIGIIPVIKINDAKVRSIEVNKNPLSIEHIEW